MKTPFACPDFDSDKIRVGLMEEYKKILNPLVQRKVSLLEIGVHRGGAILCWDDYLKNPDNRYRPAYPGAALHGSRCTGAVRPERQRLVAFHRGKIRAVRLVIDDGSHRRKETQNCFDVLFPFVGTGGYYVIEDWAVGYVAGAMPQYAGMVELISEIMQNVPALKMRAMNIVCEPNKTMAFFQKGEGFAS